MRHATSQDQRQGDNNGGLEIDDNGDSQTLRIALLTALATGYKSKSATKRLCSQATTHARRRELTLRSMSLKKSFMVCESEARQVEECQRERERIGE